MTLYWNPTCIKGHGEIGDKDNIRKYELLQRIRYVIMCGKRVEVGVKKEIFCIFWLNFFVVVVESIIVYCTIIMHSQLEFKLCFYLLLSRLEMVQLWLCIVSFCLSLVKSCAKFCCYFRGSLFEIPNCGI